MTTATRSGPKGKGKIVLEFDEEPGRPPVTLSAYEVRAAYRALYSETPTKRREAEQSEIERSHVQAGVPVED